MLEEKSIGLADGLDLEMGGKEEPRVTQGFWCKQLGG